MTHWTPVPDHPRLSFVLGFRDGPVPVIACLPGTHPESAYRRVGTGESLADAERVVVSIGSLVVLPDDAGMSVQHLDLSQATVSRIVPMRAERNLDGMWRPAVVLRPRYGEPSRLPRGERSPLAQAEALVAMSEGAIAEALADGSVAARFRRDLTRVEAAMACLPGDVCREGYEELCGAADVDPIPDEAIVGMAAVLDGSFRMPEDSADRVISMRLAAARLAGIEMERMPRGEYEGPDDDGLWIAF